MNEPHFSGPATPEELLAYIIKLARDTREAQNDAQLVRQEVRTALKNFEEKNKSILTKTEAIQKSYAPDSVKEAVRAASAVLARFDGESEDLIVKLGKRADRVSRNLLMRTAFWAVVTAACLAFAGWVVVKYVPSLTEIADRRAGLQSLQDQITAESSKLERLKNRLVLGSDGRWYVPYRDPVKLCGDNNRQETCALHVPVE